MNLESLFRAEIALAPIQELGEGRRFIAITGGRFAGKRLSGEVLPGGGDSQIVHPDGTLELDARYVLRTADGALIYVRNHGYRKDAFMRTSPRFDTGDARYAWLNRMVCVASGVRRAASVEIDVYEVK